MADTTEWGVPKGSVAKRPRQILYPTLTDHQVEAIIVCLMAHLLVERNLNELLYRWLMQDVPRFVEHEKEKQSSAEEDLWLNIVKIDFAKKYSLLEPFFAAHFPEEAKNVWRINELRNDIFHAKVAIEDAKFEGHSISEEKTVENLFLAAQPSPRSSVSSKKWSMPLMHMLIAGGSAFLNWGNRLDDVSKVVRKPDVNAIRGSQTFR
jgi:hypothetical protein